MLVGTRQRGQQGGRGEILNLVGILERAERGAPESALRGLVRGLQVRTGQRLPSRRAARPGRAMTTEKALVRGGL
jgi:hypothetical protein